MRREQVRIEKNSEHLTTAYQEGLVILPPMRQRMPALQKQAQAVGLELQSLEMAVVDKANTEGEAYWKERRTPALVTGLLRVHHSRLHVRYPL